MHRAVFSTRIEAELHGSVGAAGAAATASAAAAAAAAGASQGLLLSSRRLS